MPHNVIKENRSYLKYTSYIINLGNLTIINYCELQEIITARKNQIHNKKTRKDMSDTDKIKGATKPNTRSGKNKTGAAANNPPPPLQPRAETPAPGRTTTAEVTGLEESTRGPGTPIVGNPNTGDPAAGTETGGANNTGNLGSPTTTFVAKAAQRLEFRVRGHGGTEMLAENWAQLVALTDRDWTDAAARITDYEAQGLSFRADWTRILAAEVRDEFEIQQEFIFGGDAEKDVFERGKYAAGHVIERIKHVVDQKILAKAEPTVDPRPRAIAAIAKYIRDEAPIVPTKDQHPDEIFIAMREILNKEIPNDKGLQKELIHDREYGAAVHREFMARINALDTANTA